MSHPPSSTPSHTAIPRQTTRTTIASLTLAATIATGGLGTHHGIPQASATPDITANIPYLHPPVHHDDAPTPHAFPPQEYTWYLSDLSSHPFGIYADVIGSYPDLMTHHPDIQNDNLAILTRINHGAATDPNTITRAHNDARAETEGVLHLFADAFGQRLGDEFRQALHENRLPKTVMLFGGLTARAGGLASSTIAEKLAFNETRPYDDHPDQINKYEIPGANLYGHTKAFPSGHTNQATWTTTLLAAMLPELSDQLLARGSEAGYHRIVLGVHYPLDVIGGRMTGLAAAADRWNDPRMRNNLMAAAQEIRSELEWRCGDTLATCVAADKKYDDNAVGNYTYRMNYDFPSVGDTTAPMTVPQAAPDLLTNAFPNLTYQQRAQIIQQTAGPAGMPLDDPTPRGSWQRINLAAAMKATVTIDDHGNAHVT
ncbi:phosphatase PAP2 family protein [Corynebacterium kroppenstedtii]|uniref:phosphatase PAP2 family protein n=1 Tax=Corynebacterium sp. PCR 32 TaxID=3351342 RepID=UPI0030A371F2